VISPKRLLALLLLFTAIFRMIYLNHPFERNPEGCAAFYGLLARNYFRYDFPTTHGIPVMSMGLHAEPIFYANHSPLTPLLIAAVDKMIGYNGSYAHLPPDWSVRLPTTLLILACIFAIYFLIKNRATARAAIIATALFATIPMTLIYGGFADVISPHLLLFILLTVAAYEHFHDNPNRKTFAILLLAFFAAAIVDWPAFYLVPVFALHFLLTHRLKYLIWIIAFGFSTAIIFAAIYSYLAVAQHDWLWMNFLIKRRASNVGDSYNHFSWPDWFHHALWQFAIGQHTLIVVILALLSPLAVSRSNRAIRFTMLLSIWGILHVLIGRQGVYQHPWWWWPMTPALVIAAALTLDAMLIYLQNKRVASVTVLNASLVACFIIFAIVNVRNSIPQLTTSQSMSPDAPELNYTPIELGQLIRDDVSPDQTVLLAESDTSLSPWYYADRAMKRWIWDPITFQNHLDNGFVELSFDTHQPWHGQNAAIIIPKAYLPKNVQQFADYLDAHYPRYETKKFLVYNLR
jgi:4-amino-4-deoxy-L-arabinose transferase-like glycosyltransferase